MTPMQGIFLIFFIAVISQISYFRGVVDGKEMMKERYKKRKRGDDFDRYSSRK